MSGGIEKLVALAFERALAIDREKARRHVERLKLAHPSDNRKKLVERLIARSRIWAAASGLLSGWPSNPLVAAPASLADMAALLRIETSLAARIALVYDPGFLDSPDAPCELLLPIFGLEKSAAAMRDAGFTEFSRISRRRFKTILGRNGMGVLRDVLLKLFGVQILQRGIVSKTMPVIGGLFGGGINWRELARAGRRVEKWFEEAEICTDKGDAE